MFLHISLHVAVTLVSASVNPDLVSKLPIPFEMTKKNIPYFDDCFPGVVQSLDISLARKCHIQTSGDYLSYQFWR